jgi:hypothetical protein
MIIAEPGFTKSFSSTLFSSGLFHEPIRTWLETGFVIWNSFIELLWVLCSADTCSLDFSGRYSSPHQVTVSFELLLVECCAGHQGPQLAVPVSANLGLGTQLFLPRLSSHALHSFKENASKLGCILFYSKHLPTSLDLIFMRTVVRKKNKYDHFHFRYYQNRERDL